MAPGYVGTAATPVLPGEARLRRLAKNRFRCAAFGWCSAFSCDETCQTSEQAPPPPSCPCSERKNRLDKLADVL